MPHRTSDSDDSDNQDDEQNAEHNNSDEEDSDSGPVPDATTGIVELESDEFPSYFFERNGRLFHSSTSPYPLPVDTPEQQVRAPCRQLQTLADFLSLLSSRSWNTFQL
jgi:hypothetical protein